MLSSIVTLIPFGLFSRMHKCTVLKGHWRLFVLVSGPTCARLSWILSCRVHVKLSYRIVSYWQDVQKYKKNVGSFLCCFVVNSSIFHEDVCKNDFCIFFRSLWHFDLKITSPFLSHTFLLYLLATGHFYVSGLYWLIDWLIDWFASVKSNFPINTNFLRHSNEWTKLTKGIGYVRCVIDTYQNDAFLLVKFIRRHVRYGSMIIFDHGLT